MSLPNDVPTGYDDSSVDSREDTLSLRGRRVLITGGAGFVGSNLANALVTDNDVTVLDDGSLGIAENLDPSVTFVDRSVLDQDLPTEVDVVFHLAARSSYAMHEVDPAGGVRVNVEGFVNVVEQARRNGCETVVYASTSSIYGSQTAPSSERLPVTARTAYEASKLAREAYAAYFSSHYGLRLAGLRFFSVYQGYGGNEGHKADYANVIAQFADDLAAGRSPMLYGDGQQTRDFTHVDDVVAALIAAAEHRLDGVYNVGTGRAVSFATLVAMLNAELGTEIEPTFVDNPIPDTVYVHDTLADASKLREATGWEPRTSLEEGLERVCATYASPAGGR